MTDSAAETVGERLRVAAYVIDKMRAAVPTHGGRHPGTIIGPFAAEHKQMVDHLIWALSHCMGPLRVHVEDHRLSPRANRTIVCEWVESRKSKVESPDL